MICKINQYIKSALLTAFMLASGTAAQAADASVTLTSPCGSHPTQERCLIGIDIKGTITPATAAAFQALIDQEAKRTGQAIKPLLEISSSGGDVYAAMRIGRALRRNLGVVESGLEPHVCYSACALVASGAVSRTAFVGIHRPYFVQASSESLQDADARYKRTMADVRDYLREMNMPDGVYQLMETIKPGEMRRLTMEEGKQFGFIGEDPAYQELQIAGEARKRGMTSLEYRQLQARLDSICGSEDDVPNIAVRTGGDVVEIGMARYRCMENAEKKLRRPTAAPNYGLPDGYVLDKR